MSNLWGMPLKEVQWNKFGTMFTNTSYHLRRTKFVVYQAAMILGIAAQALGVAVMEAYISSANALKKATPPAYESNTLYIGLASYNIVIGIFVSFVFGIAFFLDLFWPERQESRSVKNAWKMCSIVAVIGATASVIFELVVLTTKSGTVTGVSSKVAQTLLRSAGSPPLAYKQNGKAIAAAAFTALGYPFVVASAIVMWMSLIHDAKHGPFAAHMRSEQEDTAVLDGPVSEVGIIKGEEKDVAVLR